MADPTKKLFGTRNCGCCGEAGVVFGASAALDDSLQCAGRGMLSADNCGAAYIGSGNGGEYIVTARHCPTVSRMTTMGGQTVRVEPILPDNMEAWIKGIDVQLYRVADEDEALVRSTMRPLMLSKDAQARDSILMTSPLYQESEGAEVNFVGSKADHIMVSTVPESRQKPLKRTAWPVMTTEPVPASDTLTRTGYSGSPWLDEHGLTGVHSFASYFATPPSPWSKTIGAVPASTVKSIMQGLGIRDYGGESFTKYQGDSPPTRMSGIVARLQSIDPSYVYDAALVDLVAGMIEAYPAISDEEIVREIIGQ